MKSTYYFLLVVLMVTSCKTKQIELSLNLDEGKEYAQSYNSSILLNQTVMGQKMEIEMTLKGDMTYKVNKKTGNEYDITAQYDQMGMEMKSQMFNMNFNSENESSDNPFNQMMSGLTDKPFEIVMNKKGEVENVKNIDQLFASIYKQYTNIPEDQMAQMKSQIDNAFGEESFKSNLESSTAIFPDNPVKVGDSWTITSTQKSNFEMDVTTDYTLVENKDDYYLIKGVSKIATPDSAGYSENSGMMMQYNMSGTMTSDIKINKETGWVIETTINQNLSGMVDVKPSDQLPDGMELPMKITSETIIKGK